MNLAKYLDVAPEVAQAVAAGKPVVALESTIISHGMPYPQNVETALKVEQIIRDNGAVPATIAILGGRLKAGCTKEEIEYLGKQGHIAVRTNRVDIAIAELAKRGYEVDMETAGYKNGRINAVYLKDQIGGFAVHLLQK